MKRKIIILIGLISAVLFFIGLYSDNYILRMVTKPIPVLTLILLLKSDSRFKQFILLGLIFSLFGDVLIESSPEMFVFGLLAFLIGHIAYIVAFSKRNRQISFLPLTFIMAFGIGFYWFLYSGLKEMAIPVLIYILVILTMVWRAIAQRKFDKYAKFAVIGSLLFAFSDSIIAINKFHTSLPYARWIIMFSYWIAQSLIFYSVDKSVDRIK